MFSADQQKIGFCIMIAADPKILKTSSKLLIFNKEYNPKKMIKNFNWKGYLHFQTYGNTIE